MHGPPLVAWSLVTLSTVAAVACLLRREAARDEALMGAGMAVMAVPMSVLDPRPWGTPLLPVVFAVVFALAGVRALLLVRRPGHHLHHCVCSAAMVYMAVAMGGAASAHGGHAGHMAHSGAGLPLLTGALLLYFAGYVLRAGTTLVAAPAHAHGAASGPLISAGPSVAGPARVPLRHAPEVAVACRVSMALGMFAMLLTL
ncbi:protein of unknown function [Actinacidiphila alni]|uniref:DUF5134 domain-containing protein n=1 Tax=Actinacidiphila alni TaxID=380248 RepID=A0A1I2JSW8_9ACTN|nr:DUF5134 domain-containing protein [Actinacidiphila alni]SFF57188.1 protein of unknown function [Actinacidiphila alni]